jgi:perosamine synthetase
MDRILKIARDHHLWVIEDAAQALGTEYAGKRAGSFGDMACFSFYANKLVTSGEGGMVVTRKKSLLKKITLLKNHCLTRKRFYHEDLGYNFRMSNLSAAYAYASFREISRNLRIKLEHARLYRSLLSNVPGLTLPPENGPREKSAYWMFGILVNPSRFGLTKNRLRKQLKIKYDIETRDFFCPMHRQPALIKRGLIAPGEEFPVSDSIYQNGLYLPSGLVLSGDQIKAVTGAVRRIHKMKGLKC